MTYKKAKLVLQNGQSFNAWSFGYDSYCDGEIVFSTAMVGYPESLTDPSYSGQILCVSYPLIGNYGIPSRNKDNFGLSENFESEKIYVRGLVISNYSEVYSHWDAMQSLGDWLKEEKVPGIFGVDTRYLTQILREEGAMLAKIVIANEHTVIANEHTVIANEHTVIANECEAISELSGLPRPEGLAMTDFTNVKDPNQENQVAIVSCTQISHYGSGEKKVVLVDCGVKHHIIRCLIKRGVEVIRVPWDYDFNQIEWDGLFISNGPGNPSLCSVTVNHIRKAMQKGKPIFGICMGNQLLSIAAGASTFKLKYGHRSHNQPVRMVGTNKCFITSQNHGFAVDNSTLPSDWEPYFVNMNDGTNEGIRHKTLPYFSAQFHPEASSGPVDTEFLFDEFISSL